MKISITIVLFIFSSTFLVGQQADYVSDFAVYYEMIYVPDLSKLDERKNTYTILLIGEQKSIFKTYGRYLQDSLLSYHSKIGTGFTEFGEIKKQFPGSSHNFQIVKDNNLVSIYDKIIPDNYVFEVDKIQWEIIDEKKELAGFTVQKAVTEYGGRTWEAWFSEEIPIADGPYVFNGLPGLILGIKDLDGHYEFSLFKINKATKVSLKPYLVKKPIKIKEKSFFKLRNEFHLNASEKLSLTNLKVNDRQLARQVDERFRSKMNFIEREF